MIEALLAVALVICPFTVVALTTRVKPTLVARLVAEARAKCHFPNLSPRMAEYVEWELSGGGRDDLYHCGREELPAIGGNSNGY
jgi:hypothetical protein